jgi:PAS domain S-box-containing protein
VDEAQRRELLAVFLLDAPGRLERIGARLEAGDGHTIQPEQVAEAELEAHSLFGAAATLGLDEVEALADRLELTLGWLASADGDDALAVEARALLAEIAARLDQLDPGTGGESQARSGAPTVLHVDDDPVSARLISRALARRPGLRLLAAPTVETGLRLARSERPELVLVDLRLPDGSGLALAGRLKLDPATRDIPVVVVSGEADTSGDELERFGIRERLTKPVDVGRLLELVDELAPTDGGDGTGANAFRDREIVDAVPNGIVLLDLDGFVLDLNPATERLLGYERTEIVGKSCAPFTHPDDHAKELPLLGEVLEGRSEGYTIEKRYLRKDGEPVWARLELRLIRGEQGEPRRVLGLIEDVSERRRADEEIRTILECVTDGFVGLDTEWNYTYVNDKAGELLGTDPSDLIGKNIWEVFPEGVGQPFYHAYHRAMAEQTTITLEEHFPPWDRWFENRIYGSRTGIAIYFTDVTERKRVEEAELRQHERAEALRDATEALTRTLDLEEMLGVLLDSLIGFVPYTSACVLLASADSELSIGALRGYEHVDPALLAGRLAGLRGRPTVRAIVDHDRTLVFDETRAGAEGGALLAPELVESWIGVPLRAAGQVIGLCAVECSEPRAFGADDVDWLEALTAHAAVAIENARLHDQLRRRAGELERRLGELAEAQRVAHVGSFEWDIRANRVSWSDELYRIYGLEPGVFEATFEAFVERIHPDDRATVTSTIGAAVENGEQFRMRERIVRPSGEIRQLSSWGEVMTDEEGKPRRLLGICHDVTEEQRQRERADALREASDALTRTLDLDEVLGILLDSLATFVRYEKGVVGLLDGQSELEIRALRGFDPSDTEAIAQRVATGSVRPAAQRVLAEGVTIVVAEDDTESVGRPLGGQIEGQTWIGTPLRAGGQVIGMCAVQSIEETSFTQQDIDWVEGLAGQAAAAIENARLHDRVRRHATELEQRVDERTRDLSSAKDEAERASRAKSDFLTHISHELRTPMNAILGFAQLLELDDLGGEQGDNVRQILRAGRHLLELITELLDIARIEAGELALSLEPVSIYELLVEAIDLTRPLAEQHDVTLSVDGDLDGYVLADRQRVLQVLLNLLGNAVKYNRRGGSVDVECRRVEGGRVAFAVHDTGSGIAREDLERLFTPFERLGLDGGPIEGAGLGLALAKHLVDAMDGTIDVTSTPGEGSTFTVELPASTDPLLAVEAAGGDGELPEARAATIVYIEDNVANLRLVERALARQPNLTVLTATRGRPGLELVRECRPDLVLLDLHLPDASGEEILDELTAGRDTSSIPVVIVSAAASKGRVQGLRARGARDYLTKPIDLKQLLSVVDAVLGAGARAGSR